MGSLDALKITEKDSVAVALRPLRRGDRIAVGCGEVEILDAIPVYHKFAVEGIPAGEKILKYGECIGVAMDDISAGAHVHVHNVRPLRGEGA